jgi:acyl-CoA synthetase (AMP-forming)/AMP-acid ligase II
MSRAPSSVTPYLPVMTELASHPDVLEVSVVGREHPTWGERPMAYVVLHTESARRWAGKHAEFSSVLKAHARCVCLASPHPNGWSSSKSYRYVPFVTHVHMAFSKDHH